MQTTISLKIPVEALKLIKKSAKLRDVSMSDLVRQAVYNDVNYKDGGKKENNILSYFGFIKSEEDKAILDEVFDNIEKGRKKLNIGTQFEV